MKDIPFQPYDFFGYLASGLIVIIGCEVAFGVPHVLGADLTVLQNALLLLAIYVVGQAVATPAKAVLEDLLVGRVLGRPSTALFKQKAPWFWRILFPGYFKPLPAAIANRIREKAATEGVREIGEVLFLHVRFGTSVLSNEPLMARLSTFINQYGFARNLCFSTALLGVTLLIRSQSSPTPDLAKYGWLAVAAAVMLLYRYLKFYRQYSYELFNSYRT